MAKAKNKAQASLIDAVQPAARRSGGIVQQPGKPPVDPISVAGAPLRQSERDELDAIANEYGATPASLASTAIRYYIREYKAGRVQLHVKGGNRSRRFYLPDSED